MTNQHPITPPPELAQQWVLEAHSKFAPPGTCPDTRILIARAAQWGADKELEACCEWLRSQHHSDTWPSRIRAARRPKAPSLKEQALVVLMALEIDEPGYEGTYNTIRRALEQLDD